MQHRDSTFLPWDPTTTRLQDAGDRLEICMCYKLYFGCASIDLYNTRRSVWEWKIPCAKLGSKILVCERCIVEMQFDIVYDGQYGIVIPTTEWKLLGGWIDGVVGKLRKESWTVGDIKQNVQEGGRSHKPKVFAVHLRTKGKDLVHLKCMYQVAHW